MIHSGDTIEEVETKPHGKVESTSGSVVNSHDSGRRSVQAVHERRKRPRCGGAGRRSGAVDGTGVRMEIMGEGREGCALAER